MNNRTSAFTLIELLVVIAIIGTLVALLLPAIQAAREASRRSQCQNNLRQIGIAMHNFHAANGSFPSGFQSKALTIDGPGLGPGWGWVAHLLPYLEQANVQVDIDRDITDPIHDSVRLATFPVLLCPSDPEAERSFSIVDSSNTEITSLGFTNYVGMAGTDEVTSFPDTATGVFFRNKSIRIAEITDGTSQTLAVGERRSRSSPQTTWVGAITDAIVPPLNLDFEEEGPPVLILTNTGSAEENRVPNNMLGHVEDTTSEHPNGVNFLFCDGSVRMIADSIDVVVWVAIGTRAGDEVVGNY